MKKNSNVPEVYSNNFLKDDIRDTVQAVEFDGINYYTPNGTVTIPSYIDNMYANTISITDGYNNSFTKDKDYEDVFLPSYNYDRALELVTNNVAITVTSLYKRFIYEINTIIQDNNPICESPYILSDIKNIIVAFILDAIDRVKYIDITKYDSDVLYNSFVVSMLECMNGLGLMIYNDTMTQFTNKLYSNNNFDSDFVQDAFAKYMHSHNMFIIDLTTEVAPMTLRMLQGVNFIVKLSYDSSK